MIYIAVTPTGDITIKSDSLEYVQDWIDRFEPTSTIVTLDEDFEGGKRYVDGELVEAIIVPANDEELLESRRLERRDVFTDTLDKLNWFWASSMTIEQQDEVAAWRQAWLDYPATGIKPDMLPYLPY